LSEEQSYNYGIANKKCDKCENMTSMVVVSQLVSNGLVTKILQCDACNTIQAYSGASSRKDGRLFNLHQDVLTFDQYHGVLFENERKFENVLYNALALGGEAGELVNVVKKMWRDGITEKHINHLGEEMVDVVIYLIKLIECSGIDFDKAWEEKHGELYTRWRTKQMGQRAVGIYCEE